MSIWEKISFRKKREWSIGTGEFSENNLKKGVGFMRKLILLVIVCTALSVALFGCGSGDGGVPTGNYLLVH